MIKWKDEQEIQVPGLIESDYDWRESPPVRIYRSQPSPGIYGPEGQFTPIHSTTGAMWGGPHVGSHLGIGTMGEGIMDQIKSCSKIPNKNMGVLTRDKLINAVKAVFNLNK